MGLCSTSAIGRIFAAWSPIVMFFAQGFEHSVVDVFIIPVRAVDAFLGVAEKVSCTLSS
jgi:formate/nitrite transporter FocA (FNT family)